MKRPLSPRRARDGRPAAENTGSIFRDEVLLLAEVGRRLKWGPRMLSEVQRMGFPTTLVGRQKMTTGQAVYDFVSQRLAEVQQPGNGQGGA